MTRDAAAAKKFYSELIGWTITDQEMGGMTYSFLTTPEGEQVGGMMQMDGPQFEGVPPHWMQYILVEDVDDRAQKCTELGGKVKVPPTDIPNMGRFCVIEDPTGGVIALFQAK
ncbi:MAG: VOC family protein [Armatimonadetes bacterium]|nr:VOC family protein [Armatimonadota bacterium]